MQDDLSVSNADRIREAYVQFRRRIHRGYIPNKVHDDAWRKAAKTCASIEADPHIFVEAQFVVGVWGKELFPYPTQLSTTVAEENYQKFIDRTDFRSEPEAKMTVQFRYLANMTHRCGKTIDKALMCPSNERVFTNYFRILVCSEELFPAFLEVCGEKARREVEANSALHEYLLKNYAYRTQRLFWTAVPGYPVGACGSPPAPSVPGREREI